MADWRPLGREAAYSGKTAKAPRTMGIVDDKMNDRYDSMGAGPQYSAHDLYDTGAHGDKARAANAAELDSQFIGDRNGNKKWGAEIDREIRRDENRKSYKDYSGSLKDKLKDAAQYRRDRRDAEERTDRYDRVMPDRWGENGKIAQKEALDHDKMVAKNILTGKTKVPDADRKLLMQRLIEEKMNGGRDNLAPWVKDLNKKYNLGYSEE